MPASPKTAYVALLRAVNVLGTGKLPMADLALICRTIGFDQVKTYIASGNVVFLSPLSEPEVKSALEEALAAYSGKPMRVLIRTAREMAAVLAANPFPNALPNRNMAFFLDHAPPPDALTAVTLQRDEQLATGLRELYVHYPNGQGESRIHIRAVKDGTARNLNTIAKLAQIAADLTR